MQYYESPAYGKWCERVYGMDCKQMGMVTKDEMDLLFRELTLPDAPDILDIGCGPGYLTAAVASRYTPCAALGIDIDREAIAHAQRVFRDPEQPEFREMDANAAAGLGKKFDLILLFDALYFTQTKESLSTFMDDCYHMLKPGGKIAVTWTNRPDARFSIFDMTGDSGHDAQPAIWGTGHGVRFRVQDVTDRHRQFWQQARRELQAMRQPLIRELPEFYERLEKQCAYFTGLCENDPCKLYRWLYIFEKDG